MLLLVFDQQQRGDEIGAENEEEVDASPPKGFEEMKKTNVPRTVAGIARSNGGHGV
jgi:hypothetical protein